MKAVRFHEYGGIDVLRYEDVDRPRPGSGEVLVQVAGAAFNPIDTWFRAGILAQVYPVTLPYTLGIDVAGTVVELGDGVVTPTVGDAVIGFLPLPAGGAAAEFVIAPASVLVAAPHNVPLADAAAIPVAALTASQALFELGGLKSGQRVLVNGAGGGVGGFAVQLAKGAGAGVIATASARSAEKVASFGANAIIDYTRVRIGDVLYGQVDLVVNLVAGTREDTVALLDVIKPGGVLVSATSPGGEFPEHDVRVEFVHVRSDPAQLTQIVRHVQDGTLRLDISDRRPLAETRLVHEQSESGAVRGRVVLVPGE
jgi:NADPH:quinone reductase-like Zn-dependent oxidoreductase